MARSYSELITIPTYEERFEYLKTKSKIGLDTFGHNRWINQYLYMSPEWKHFRKEIIVRDNACDLAFYDRPIIGSITVHHINPITVEQVMNHDPIVFDPDNVVTVWTETHRFIHYEADLNIPNTNIERAPNDTCPWR